MTTRVIASKTSSYLCKLPLLFAVWVGLYFALPAQSAVPKPLIIDNSDNTLFIQPENLSYRMDARRELDAASLLADGDDAFAPLSYKLVGGFLPAEVRYWYRLAIDNRTSEPFTVYMIAPYYTLDLAIFAANEPHKILSRDGSLLKATKRQHYGAFATVSLQLMPGANHFVFYQDCEWRALPIFNLELGQRHFGAIGVHTAVLTLLGCCGLMLAGTSAVLWYYSRRRLYLINGIYIGAQTVMTLSWFGTFNLLSIWLDGIPIVLVIKISTYLTLATVLLVTGEMIYHRQQMPRRFIYPITALFAVELTLSVILNNSFSSTIGLASGILGMVLALGALGRAALVQRDPLIRAGFVYMLPAYLGIIITFALPMGLLPITNFSAFAALPAGAFQLFGFFLLLGQMIIDQQKDLFELEKTRYADKQLFKLNSFIQDRLLRSERTVHSPEIHTLSTLGQGGDFWHFHDFDPLTGKLCFTFGHLPARSFAAALGSLAVKTKLYALASSRIQPQQIDTLFNSLDRLLKQLGGNSVYDFGIVVYDGSTLKIRMTGLYQIELDSGFRHFTRVSSDSCLLMPRLRSMMILARGARSDELSASAASTDFFPIISLVIEGLHHRNDGLETTASTSPCRASS